MRGNVRRAIVEPGRRIAAVAALVVTMLFPMPVPGALADPNAQTAAQTYGWGDPARVEDFTGDLSQWDLYDGEGHDGNGRRTPSAASVGGGVLTIKGDRQGDAEGMAWKDGAMYGRWEARMRASAGDPDYHAVLLLWPDDEDEGEYGGEIDFMENSDPTRQNTELFVHYGNEDRKLNGDVDIDATQWHNWAVEWAPDHISAFLDGKQWWTTDNRRTQPPGPMHMTVQLDLFRHPGGLKPSDMQVDWVRYYPIEGSGPSPQPESVDGPRASAAPSARPTARAHAPAPPVAAQPTSLIPSGAGAAASTVITLVSTATSAGSTATAWLLTAAASALAG
jgi:glycosyl hydrolase family 16